jgi:hypothetical protein
MTLSIIWISIASLLGFAVIAVFAGWLKLKRDVYLLFYIPLVSALFIECIISNKIGTKVIVSHKLAWGLLGAVIAGAFVIKNVYSQPSSKRSTGLALLADITWPVLVYGLMDALLLSVLHVLAIKIALIDPVWIQNWFGKIGFCIIGLFASFIVTTDYHLVYPEFRGKKVIYINH